MSEYELKIIEFESACNEAMDNFFNVRPHIARNKESEFLFAGGFRIAWNDKQKAIANCEKTL